MCYRTKRFYCLQARSCIFQPGNITCWGSKGVKVSTDNQYSIGSSAVPDYSLDSVACDRKLWYGHEWSAKYR